jgi:predicted DNA-binding protein
VQRDYQLARTMLLDLQTGSVTIISKDDIRPVEWLQSEVER